MLQKMMLRINQLAEKLAGLFLVGMVLSVSISVFARLLYTYTGVALSVTWAEELSRYMMVGSVFIGGAVAAYRLRLIGVDVFAALAPARLARWLRLMAHLSTLVFALLLVWKSARLIELGLRQWSPAMEIQMTYVYSLMFAGCVLLAANTVMHVIREFSMSAEKTDAEPTPKEPLTVIQRSQESLS